LRWRQRGWPAKASRPRWSSSILYLTGPRFRHRIEAFVERFSEMQADLDRERKVVMRLRANLTKRGERTDIGRAT
jgi:hypothetical protein